MPRSRAQSSSATGFLSPCPFSAQTPAERAREKKLRDDPMAIVVDPLYVDCKRCGARIKLSSKSLYDNFHWRTHRARCLKKPVSIRNIRREKTTSSSPTPGGIDPPFDEPSIVPHPPSTPGSSELHFRTNLELLTTVASAAASKRSATTPEEYFLCRGRREEREEWQLRQEAIESLALLSRSA